MFTTTLLQYKDTQSRWDIKGYIGKISSIFPVVRLGAYISERSEKIRLNDYPKEVFSILGVNNRQGIVDAYNELGENINQSYKRVEIGDISYNPYRINVGSVGVAREGLIGRYISPAYVVFYCHDSRILTDYLYLILSSNWFNLTLRANTTGAVRQNLTFSLLSDLYIPLPSVSIQQQIIDEFYRINSETLRLEDENKKFSEKVDKYLMDALGIVIENKVNKTSFVTNYKDLDRWDTRSFLSKSYSSIFPEKNIKSVATSVHRGKTPKYDEEGEFYAVSQKCVGNVNFDLGRARKWSTEHASGIDKKFLITKDDILINSTGEGTIGRVAIVDKDYQDCITDTHVTTVRVRENMLNPWYFVYYFNSKHGQSRLSESFSGGTKQKELTKSKFETINFPLPPLTQQNEIVEGVNQIKQSVLSNERAINNLVMEKESKIKTMILNGSYL